MVGFWYSIQSQSATKEMTDKENNQSQARGSPRVTDSGCRHFINKLRNTYIAPLCEERAKQGYIPGSLRLLSGSIYSVLIRFLRIYKVIGAIFQGPANDEWSFPWRRQLVHAGCALHLPEHQVSLAKLAGFHFSRMIAAKSLLVYGCDDATLLCMMMLPCYV